MSGKLIEISHLAKIYQLGNVTVHALRGVTLEIERGSFVAIMGPSGSGKSTFMNIVGCLDKPTSGSYVLDGVNTSTLTRDQLADIRNQKIGFVFQQFNLLARTNAAENVEPPLLYSSRNTQDRRRKALRALAWVGLEGREDHNPNQLSGGQQQRVAIARALINDPQIILADEPTGALDSRTSVEIMALFQRLNRDSGMSIILVTHEPDIAACARRTVAIRDGLVTRDQAVQGRRVLSASGSFDP